MSTRILLSPPILAPTPAVASVFVLWMRAARGGFIRGLRRGRGPAPWGHEAGDAAPWRADVASVGARIALISRDLPQSEVGAALRTAGCSTSLADFIATRSRPSADPFTCTICWEDCAAGVMAVDLECSPEEEEAEITPGAASDAGADRSKPASEAPAHHRFCPPCIAAALHMRPACPLCQRNIGFDAGDSVRGGRVHPHPPAAEADVAQLPPPAAIGVDIAPQQGPEAVLPRDHNATGVGPATLQAVPLGLDEPRGSEGGASATQRPISDGGSKPTTPLAEADTEPRTNAAQSRSHCDSGGGNYPSHIVVAVRSPRGGPQ